MKDGPALRLLKWAVRGAWWVEWGVRRRLDPGPWRLGGECRACARCCERPAIRAGPLTFWLPWVRAAFLAWQRRVNGFELVEADPDSRSFLFRCSHFDWSTRRCDSYASRPFMCRDYPRGLLAQPWPELFDGCGHTVRLKKGDGLAAALDATDLDPAARAELKRRLRVE